MLEPHYHVACQVRVRLGENIALGPGKTELLAAIAKAGSISAAARSMGMSYRRAWLLVETMNNCFEVPLVETATGGKAGGGAQLSEAGRSVLQGYRQMMEKVDALAQSELEQLLAQNPLKSSS
ncbi:MAG: LysR family transcriptional regulator [Pseudohongiellaceae bacterium]|nr:LysR family transcriptional regulator [Pseudohongiellaceae bacterium]